MPRLLFWSLMIFLIFNLAALVRADQTFPSPAPADAAAITLKNSAASADETVRPILRAADPYATRIANFQQLFGTVVAENYGWAWERASDIPEPASVVLLMIGGMLMFGRFRKQA